MRLVEELKNSDFIVSIGSFFENDDLRNIVLNRVKNGKFVYMSSIDNHQLKSSYDQFIKYEAGSEEAVLALLLNSFAQHLDDKTKHYLEELDFGYLAAESSAGEEEFDEANDLSFESNNKVLLIGDDIKNHPRVENIARLLGKIEKFTDFSLIVLDSLLEKKIEHFKDETLEEIDNLKAFNGTVVYEIVSDNKYLIASQTFLNIAKLKSGDMVSYKIEAKRYKKEIILDENLFGTIAITNKEHNLYSFCKVALEKE